MWLWSLQWMKWLKAAVWMSKKTTGHLYSSNWVKTGTDLFKGERRKGKPEIVDQSPNSYKSRIKCTD